LGFRLFASSACSGLSGGAKDGCRWLWALQADIDEAELLRASPAARPPAGFVTGAWGLFGLGLLANTPILLSGEARKARS
jgi:hypothetical protein